MIDKSPLSGPGISSPSCNTFSTKAFSLVENSGNHKYLHFHHGSDTRQFQDWKRRNLQLKSGSREGLKKCQYIFWLLTLQRCSLYPYSFFKGVSENGQSELKYHFLCEKFHYFNNFLFFFTVSTLIPVPPCP